MIHSIVTSRSNYKLFRWPLWLDDSNIDCLPFDSPVCERNKQHELCLAKLPGSYANIGATAGISVDRKNVVVR